MANSKYSSRSLVLGELPPNLPGFIYASTTLGTALTANNGTVTVASLSGSFQDIGDLLIDNEYIAYTGTSAAGTQFTGCTRGAHNTTAGTHANGAAVYNAYLDRTIEKMSAYVMTVLGQRYQTFTDYSATGSCPEIIEWITRGLVANEAAVRMGWLRNVGEGGKPTERQKQILATLDALRKGDIEISPVAGTYSLVFGTSNTGTLPLWTNESFLPHSAILPETVVVTNNGTTYANDIDYRIQWDEPRQKWVLSRFDDSDITDGGTATYMYSWLKSYYGKTHIGQQKTRVTNRGLLIRGA